MHSRQLVARVRHRISNLVSENTDNYGTLSTSQNMSQQQSRLVKFHDAGATLLKLRPERSGISELGRVLKFRDIVQRRRLLPRANHDQIVITCGLNSNTKHNVGTANPNNKFIRTTGTILVLTFAELVQLTE